MIALQQKKTTITTTKKGNLAHHLTKKVIYWQRIKLNLYKKGSSQYHLL